MAKNRPYRYHYRPQIKFAKVMFLHLSVSHSVHGGVMPQCMLGYTNPSPWSRQPPGPDTPLRSACWEIRSTSGHVICTTVQIHQSDEHDSLPLWIRCCFAIPLSNLRANVQSTTNTAFLSHTLMVLVEHEFTVTVMQHQLFIYIVLWRVTNQDGFQCK